MGEKLPPTHDDAGDPASADAGADVEPLEDSAAPVADTGSAISVDAGIDSAPSEGHDSGTEQLDAAPADSAAPLFPAGFHDPFGNEEQQIWCLIPGEGVVGCSASLGDYFGFDAGGALAGDVDFVFGLDSQTNQENLCESGSYFQDPVPYFTGGPCHVAYYLEQAGTSTLESFDASVIPNPPQ